MTGLYPIIRRIRRPLLPPEDPAPVAAPAVVPPERRALLGSEAPAPDVRSDAPRSNPHQGQSGSDSVKSVSLPPDGDY